MASYQNYIFRAILLAIIYFLAGKVSFASAQANSIITIVIFTSEGFALAAALIYGRSVLPGIFFGQLFLALSGGIDTLPALLISLTNTAEASIAIILFKKFKLQLSLKSLRDLLGLFLLIALVLQPFSATVGNLILLGFGITQAEEFMVDFFSWWLGNTMGQFLITPFLLYLWAEYKKINILESLLIATLFFFVTYFIIIIVQTHYLALLFSTTLTLVILLSTQRGMFYTSLSIIVITLVSLHSAHLEIGLFSTNDEINNIISLNFYILSHILLGLIIGTLFHEKKRAIEELRHTANYDLLTGLANRNLLRELLHRVRSMYNRYKHKSAICFIDIDGFKLVNDTLGHNAGDIVLKNVAKRISNNIREEDSLVRLGGDEFVLILMNHTSNKNLEKKLETILNSIREVIVIEDKNVNVSLSIGVSIYPDNSNSTRDVMQQADKAMYIAKKIGKDTYVFFDSLQSNASL